MAVVRESLESHPGGVHDIPAILGPWITQTVDSAWKWSNQHLQAPVRFAFEMVPGTSSWGRGRWG